MIAVGQVVEATWGRYQVHRLAGDHVVLRDLGRPSAYVLPAIAAFEASYRAVGGNPALAPPTSSPAAQEQPPARQPAASVGPVCAGCQRPRVALAYVGDQGWCWRCYGVSEVATQRPAVSTLAPRAATHALDESTAKAEVGSFEPPPPEECRPRPPRAVMRTARVKGDDWKRETGEAPR